MAWLLDDQRVLATCEQAVTLPQKTKGLLGRKNFDGAMLIRNTKGVHTFGMHFAIDVAFLDRDLKVLATRSVRPWRISMPSMKAHNVLEAEVGAFERWGLNVGDVLEIKD
ncbi:MAG: DUF192 domain-containing protein [Acidimicrobiales bacterium]|nr:DUF192 domain-containing protein [Acidimicrobiales bacterium]